MNISQKAQKWLKKNKNAFGTHSGLPDYFHRKNLFDFITNGSQVAIQTPHGSLLQGRAVMKGPAGWVLNLGGSYGTPGIANEENVIWVSGIKNLTT